MTLNFKMFKKKISKKKILQLNFNFTGSKLAIIDENYEVLKFLKNIFIEKTNYSGEIFLFKNEIKDYSIYKDIFVENMGFYENFNIYQNIYNMLKLYKIKLSKEEILLQISKLNLTGKEKYSKISEIDKKKLKTLFNCLIGNKLIIIDLSNIELDNEDIKFYEELITNYSKNKLILVLSNNLNQITNKCQKVLIISDYKEVYFDNVDKLNIIKDLIILKFDKNNNYVFNDLDIDYKELDNSIIIKKSDLEKMLYYCVENDISILSIDDFNENTNLYKN